MTLLLSMYPKNSLKFLVLGVMLVTTASAAYADKDRNSARPGEPPLIIDTTAPPGLRTEAEKRQWEKRQREIWTHADEHFNHIQRGDALFQKSRYQEALQEYTQAAEKAVISSELLQAKERIANTLEAIGNFAAAMAEVEFLIQKTVNEKVRQDDLHWKQALKTAAQGRYNIAVQYYKERVATAKDWERKSQFLEQRLRIMEERARASGQFPSEDQPSSQN